MEEPTDLEKYSGGLSAGIGATTVAVLGSSITPLAAFVPFLLQSLASRRHSKRIEQALLEINEILRKHSEEIEGLSDPKYKLISESISAVFQSVDEEKIEFLKRAIDNAITSEEITEKNTALISRIIRDISVSEARFLIEKFQYKYMFIGGRRELERGLSNTPKL
nr:hypothetical protein [uncultured Pseudomonas sp.]